MEITCPNCQKVNRVAGYVPPPACPKEGKPAPQTLWCGHCGAAFPPPEAVVVAPVRDIMEG